MKKLIFVLVAGSMAFTSCDKEGQLENRLEGKWKIESFSATAKIEVTIDADPELSDVIRDSSYVENWPGEGVSVVTTGNVDFVSDEKLVMNTTTVTTTTTTTDGTTTSVSSEEEEETVYEYFVSAEDEVTLIDGNEATVYSVSNNEKDAQTWVSTDVDNDEEDVEAGDYNVNTKTKTTTTTTISMSVIED